MKAIWNNIVIAQSDQTQVVENNHYFPPDSVDYNYLEPAVVTTSCPWKGLANYYDIIVDGDVNTNGAWTYREPKSKARNIKGYVAFWRGVQVLED